MRQREVFARYIFATGSWSIWLWRIGIGIDQLDCKMWETSASNTQSDDKWLCMTGGNISQGAWEKRLAKKDLIQKWVCPGHSPLWRHFLLDGTSHWNWRCSVPTKTICVSVRLKGWSAKSIESIWKHWTGNGCDNWNCCGEKLRTRRCDLISRVVKGENVTLKIHCVLDWVAQPKALRFLSSLRSQRVPPVTLGVGTASRETSRNCTLTIFGNCVYQYYAVVVTNKKFARKSYFSNLYTCFSETGWAVASVEVRLLEWEIGTQMKRDTTIDTDFFDAWLK